MKKIIRLSKRLQAIAALVDERASVADIGTDHGKIPVYLAQTGQARHIIAVDSSAGSLETARRNAVKFGVADKIVFSHSTGLNGIAYENIDTVIIAGVGGETIADILAAAPQAKDLCAGGRLKLILQGQTKLDVLRDFLHYRGYAAAVELTVTDRGRKYIILAVGVKGNFK